MAKRKKLLFVIAPGIPTAERFALEDHVKEAFRDPSYTVVVNYDVENVEIELGKNDFLFVQAPGVPCIEVKDLRKRIDKALRKKKVHPIVANYELIFHVLQK